jgi:Carboxypeptidase regulatory-like domain
MKRLLLFLSFGLILAGTISGQTGSSSQNVDKKVVLTGKVYDFNGAVIMSSRVVAENSAGEDYQATTNGEGVYEIELPIDIYAIKVDAPGFCSSRVRFFRVRNSLSGVMPLDFVLDVSDGHRPCKQKTMIDKEPKKPEPKIRKPEIFRSIAE